MKNVEALTGGGHGMHVLVSASDWIKLGSTIQNQSTPVTNSNWPPPTTRRSGADRDK
jgi:hypothetical protein